MASITLNNVLFYKAGTSGVSNVVGYEDNTRRVARYTFTAPSSGASGVSITIPTIGRGAGSHIPIRFYIGTSATSHTNAGPSSEYTGTLTLGSDNLTFTGAADILLVPGTTYYLWVFPGQDTFGWYGWTSNSGTATMTTTGATATVISGSNGTLGVEHTLNLKRYSTSLTHTITAVCGSESVTIANKAAQADTVKWTPPASWASQNTSGTSVSVKVTCTTYNGSAAVGSTSVTLTFAVGSGDVPTVSFSVTDNEGFLNTYGSYIQLKSRAKVTVAAAGVNGSQIKSVTVTCGNLSGSGTSLVFELPNSGNITITVVVIDSRGRSASASKTITVTAYSLPVASISSVYRCDADGNEDEDAGEYVNVTFSASVTSFGGSNTAEYVLKYRARGVSSWSSIHMDDLLDTYSPANHTEIIYINSDAAHDICIEITDNFGTVESAYRTVRAAFAIMDVDKANKAIGFGQRAVKENAAAFGLPVYIDSGIRAERRIGGGSDGEAALNTWLDTQMDTMQNYSVKYVCFWNNVASEDMIHGFLFKHTSYAFFVGWSYGDKNLYHKLRDTNGWKDTTVHALT